MRCETSSVLSKDKSVMDEYDVIAVSLRAHQVHQGSRTVLRKGRTP